MSTENVSTNPNVSKQKLAITTLTIPAGQTISSAAFVNGNAPLAFVMPANLTDCNFTFKASGDGLYFSQLQDGYSGNPIQLLTATASVYSRVLPSDFACLLALQMVSSVAQTEAVTILVVSGPVL